MGDETMALTDLKLTKKESKEMDMPVTAGKAQAREKYPWGLNLELNTESLKKLKLDVSKRKVGEKVKMIVVGEVTNVRNEEDYRGDHSSLTIQMQKLGFKFNPSKKDELDYDTPDDKAEEILHKRGRI